MTQLDHLLWASPALAQGEEAFAAATGVTLEGGGSHPGLGTRNNLAGLGPGLYFELIAPDPDQAEHGPRAQKLARLPEPRMHTFSVRGKNPEVFRDAARKLGLETSDPVPMSRRRSDDVVLRWRVVYVEDEHWGDFIPFLIDWQESEHPSLMVPGGCTLKEFRVLHPQAEALSDIYRSLGISAAVARAPVAGFLVRLDTPKGEVVLV